MLDMDSRKITYHLETLDHTFLNGNLEIDRAGPREPDPHAVHVQRISPHRSPFSQAQSLPSPILMFSGHRVGFFFSPLDMHRFPS